MRAACFGVIIACAVAVAPAGVGALAPHVLKTVGEFATSTPSRVAESGTVVFYGDVLLARAVERQMRRYGAGYPFAGLLVPPGASVVANFESAVPATHVPTPDGSVRFSTDQALLPALKAARISHVSLANNHSFDFGASGFEHTVAALERADVTPFGHPNYVGTTSIAYLAAGDYTVALVGVHALWRAPNSDALRGVMQSAANQSDIIVAYVHWGQEYAATHNRAQRALAEFLVASGADLIIGHHPHVIQDVELIDGVPVIYSLGNHIFDQYFSPAVQNGLVATLHLSATPALVMTPISSISSPGQPRVLTDSERAAVLDSIARRSDAAIADDIRRGVLPLSRLATSK